MTKQEVTLLSESEYVKKRWKFPYIFKLSSGKKALLYYGVHHTNNPKDPIYADLPKRLKAFMPDLVVVEGWPAVNKISRAKIQASVSGGDARQIISRMGEVGYMVHWALEHRVPVRSPEPSAAVEVLGLLKQGISKEDIYLFYSLRLVQQWYRKHKYAVMPKKVLAGILTVVGKREFRKWKIRDASVRSFKQEFRSKFGKAFEKWPRKEFYVLVDPIHYSSRKYAWYGVNEAARVSNQLRDTYMVREIMRYVGIYGRVFVVYGGSHAIVQQPALRALFKK